MTLVLGLAIACDQVTKRIAMQALRGSLPHSYLGDLLRLQYSENQGAFLSLGGQLAAPLRFWLLTVGVGALLAAIPVVVLRNDRLTRLQVIGLSLVAGGGLSNLLDRVLGGGVVVDFLNVGIGSLRTGIFNLADLLIEAGILLLIGSGWRSDRRRVQTDEGAQR